MPWVLNLPGLGIWQDYEYATVTQGGEYVSINLDVL